MDVLKRGADMLVHRRRKYSALFAIAVRQGLSERAALIGRMFFFVLILLVFSNLWAAVGARIEIPGATMREMVWYLAITEWIVLSVPPLQLAIEEDVRRGSIAYQLPRPISYIGARFAQASGDLALRALVLGTTGFGTAMWLTGGLPSDPSGLVLALPLGVLSAGVSLCFLAAIGLTSFWLQDCMPVYWIWQKASFILGGLFLPIDLYPEWLQAVAGWTPFWAMMYGPARMAFGWQPELAAEIAFKLVLWSTIAVFLVSWTQRRGLRALDINGG